MTFPPAMSAVPDPPEEQGYGSQFDAEVEALCHAITAAANSAATSDDPEAVQRLLTGCFMGAQAIEKLMPVKPDPNVTTKVTGDVVKTGAKIAADEHRADKTSAQQANMGATDGKRNPQ